MGNYIEVNMKNTIKIASQIKQYLAFFSFLVLFVSIFCFSVRGEEFNLAQSKNKLEFELNGETLKIEEPKPDNGIHDYLPTFIADYFSSGVEIQKDVDISGKGEPAIELGILVDGLTGYIRVPSSITLDLQPKYTIEAWINYQEIKNGLGIIEKQNAKIGGYSLSLSPQGNLQFRISNASHEELVIGETFIAPNSSTHVAVVSSGKIVKLFVNGKLDSIKQIEFEPAANRGDITIGLAHNSLLEKLFFCGFIDEVRISNYIRYSDNFDPEKYLFGGGILGLTSGSWRFTNQELRDGSGNNNTGSIVGNVLFLNGESKSENGDNEQPESSISDTILSPSTTVGFDDANVGTSISTRYPGVTFYDNGGFDMYSRYSCAGGGQCPGQIGNYAGAQFLESNVVFRFSQTSTVTNFTILGAEPTHPFGERVAYLAFDHNGNNYGGIPIVSNGTASNGYGNPISININAYNCVNSPCNKINLILVYGINDYLGLGYDNFQFTTYVSPTPNPTPTPNSTPTPCFAGGQNTENPDLLPPCPLPTPIPTPTPQAPVAPTNLVATREEGSVNIGWKWSSTTSNPSLPNEFIVYKSDSPNGPWNLLIHYTQFYEGYKYSDTNFALKIGVDKYYSVTAKNSLGESSRSNVVGSSPLSACDGTPTYSPPTGDVGWSAFGWSGRYAFEQGFSVKDVLLNERMMAKQMGVPFVLVNNMTINSVVFPSSVVELEETGVLQDSFISKLTGFTSAVTKRKNINGLDLSSQYCLSSESGQEKYEFEIRYRFEEENVGEACEPSTILPCARFFPYVSSFYSRKSIFEGPYLEKVGFASVVQRLHFRENNDTTNVVALVQDCDKIVQPFAIIDGPNQCRATEFPVDFAGTKNPLEFETIQNLLFNNDEKGNIDNIHQTGINEVSLPGPFNNSDSSPAGCPSCIHDHWRWTNHALLNATTGGWYDSGTFTGKPIIGENYRQNGNTGYSYTGVGRERTQSVISSVCKYNPDEIYSGLVCGFDGLQRIWTKTRNSTTNSVSENGSDLVFTYFAVSKPPQNGVVLRHGRYEHSDLFHAHGGFFQPVRERNVEKPFSVNNTSVPFPMKIKLENYYKHSRFQYSNINSIPDESNTGTLPQGYTKLPNASYRISLPTKSIIFTPFPTPVGSDVSGSHVMTYKVPSSMTLTQFNQLRILHYETDPFETKWIDRTVLSGTDAPDFASKTIKTRVSSIGNFVLATYTPSLTSLTGQTDLKLQGSVSPTDVNGGNVIVTALSVTNQGSNIAKDVILLKSLPTQTEFLSATTTQGKCSDLNELHEISISKQVKCLTGDIAPGAVIQISITEKLRLFGNGVDLNPIEVNTSANVQSEESDTNNLDNQITLKFNAIPSNNKPPSVLLSLPANDIAYTASINSPAIIPVSISASDTDGTIQEVQVYDTGELVGVANNDGNGNFSLNVLSNRYGYHVIDAIAKDNAGRIGQSETRRVLVNSPHTLALSVPTQETYAPNSLLSIKTTSNLIGSRVQKIELFANGNFIGKLRSISNTGNVFTHQFDWQNVPRGIYTLTAILTDLSGATTISTEKLIKVTNKPTVSITSPTEGASFQSIGSINITADVSDLDGYVQNIEFYANGLIIDSKNQNIALGDITFRWGDHRDGIYSLVVAVTDDFGVTSSSNVVNIGINRQSPNIGEMIWFDDQIPSGATSGGNDGWNWVNRNPVALLGSSSHQSLLLTGEHEHYFEDSGFKLQVNAGEKLSAWIFIEPDYAPAEILLQWKEGNSWEHRAFWGQNLIANGNNVRIGDIPAKSRWVQLQIPANLVGLEGKLISGMKFSLHGGTNPNGTPHASRAAFDRIGKIAANAPPPPQEQDFVWSDDNPPSGSLLETVNDTWAWTTNAPYSGSQAHQHYNQATDAKYRQHSFRNSPTSMQVNPGDTLFTYVYIDNNPLYRPDALILQWNDDVTGWEHRAYWGRDVREFGFLTALNETENWRYMGRIPPPGQWARLEVPASYVGLEGKLVRGMAFGMYQQNQNGRAVWDYSGKTSNLPNASIRPLTFTSPMYRIRCTDLGGFHQYSTAKDKQWFRGFCQPQSEISGFLYSYPVTGSIALHEWKASSGAKRLYNTCVSCITGSWVYQGVVGHVIPGVSDPTVSAPWKVFDCPTNFLYYDVNPPTGCTNLNFNAAPIHSTAGFAAPYGN